MSKQKRQPSPATLHARAQLQQHLAVTDTAIRHAHAHMVASIQPALEVLVRDLQARRDLGEEVALHWLYEGNRLSHFTQQVERNVQHFSLSAQTMIGHAEQTARTLGTTSAKAQLKEGGKK